MSRRLFLAGNWKMNKGPAEADSLANALKKSLMDFTQVDVAVAPTSLSIPIVAKRLQFSNIFVAAQNLHPSPSGAFTGEVSGEMLRSAGCEYAIVGHSERRHVFGESDDMVKQKVDAAFRSGLLPILCVGETLSQRDAGNAATVVTSQVASAMASLQPDQAAAVTIAYEPVWAIGTGRTASPDQAQGMHAVIRQWVARHFPDYVARDIRIQYGGSVKPHNAAALLSQPDIDGALVGGAALQSESFTSLVKTAAELS
jgi:triosephosphate isomerase (TIM)